MCARGWFGASGAETCWKVLPVTSGGWRRFLSKAENCHRGQSWPKASG